MCRFLLCIRKSFWKTSTNRYKRPAEGSMEQLNHCCSPMMSAHGLIQRVECFKATWGCSKNMQKWTEMVIISYVIIQFAHENAKRFDKTKVWCAIQNCPCELKILEQRFWQASGREAALARFRALVGPFMLRHSWVELSLQNLEKVIDRCKGSNWNWICEASQGRQSHRTRAAWQGNDVTSFSYWLIEDWKSVGRSCWNMNCRWNMSTWSRWPRQKHCCNPWHFMLKTCGPLRARLRPCGGFHRWGVPQ